MDGTYIDGRMAPGGGEALALEDPSTGDAYDEIALASVDDVDAAVAAARRAFEPWARTSPAERGAAIARLADRLDEMSEELIEAERRQTGKAIRLAAEFDVPGSIDNARFFAGAARSLAGQAMAEYSPDHTSAIRREPVGVVGSIAPWNYPLQMAAWKVLPAIAAGNTIVLKPSEMTPATTLMLAQAASEAGIPDGVVNVVVGRGPDVGAALLRHQNVDMLSFTGSTRVGRSVLEAAASTVKRVHLELGGKAPFVVFDDADLEAAVRGAVAASLINGGQDCTAATRAIVHRSRYEAFLEGVAAAYAKVRVGDTADRETDLGSLISREHRSRVHGMVERAKAAGGRIIAGGAVPEGVPEGGAYYAPTLVADLDPSAELMRDEAFGPVLAAMPFDDDDEAIGFANDTPYGLAASAWTSDLGRALRATREIHAGTVWVNDHIPIISEMPHGGMKQSGFGKDMSTYSFEDYTVEKHVMFDITGLARKPWHEIIVAEREESGS